MQEKTNLMTEYSNHHLSHNNDLFIESALQNIEIFKNSTFKL